MSNVGLPVIDAALVVRTIEDGHARWDVRLKGSNIGCVAVDPLGPELINCGTFGSGLWRNLALLDVGGAVEHGVAEHQVLHGHLHRCRAGE